MIHKLQIRVTESPWETKIKFLNLRRGCSQLVHKAVGLTLAQRRAVNIHTHRKRTCISRPAQLCLERNAKNNIMKLALSGIAGIPLGKRNIKDPRLDEAHRLVEADKKTYGQIDLIGEDQLVDADAILTTHEGLPDLILKDLEFVETRLGRNPPEAEQTALLKIKTALESERCAANAGLDAEGWRAMAAHNFCTHRPVIVAEAGELQESDGLFVRAFKEAGYICFLTVGGKENRAWPVRQGVTAWEAAGTIHSDIQKGFIRAEVIGYEDFIQAGGETQAKRAGKVRLEIKNYVLQDYDLVNFRFSK
jgi:hypothetical protein